MHALHSRKLHANWLVPIAILVVGLLTAITFWITPGSGFRSAELRFTESSASGLAIVPASCPSNPHSSGECDGIIPGTCVLNSTTWGLTIPYGGSTNLVWSWTPPEGTTVAGTSITPAIGSVAQNGQMVISPLVTTAYTMAGLASNGSVTSCARTIAVCPQGQFVYQGVCVSACPVGTHIQNGFCVTDGTVCTPRYFCTGNDLFRDNDTCTGSNFVSHCPAGCAGSSCVVPPTPSISIQAIPSRVRSGRTSTVTWSAQNVITTSCYVTGNNGDGGSGVWTGVTGTRTTSAITSETTYTLHCRGLNNVDVTATARVGIIPDWEEQ